MDLLDTRGAAALTMRNLAEALDCTQASLYRHVRNREELVTLLVDMTSAWARSQLAGRDGVRPRTVHRRRSQPPARGRRRVVAGHLVIGSLHFNLGLDASDSEESRHRRLLYRSRDAAAFPLLVQHADVLAEVGSDVEFEVGVNALLTGFRILIQRDGITRD
ncbi:MAG: hypothetical protein JWQ81_5868 [Amycolatopsis sp.]|uniref:helix-turn-helix domain-containing protein n=1 Tax=Amycolatopsis sp. TaxID=37632 RepID=UPI0026225FAF|nr:TetR/AcrR family transcriptional regulator [Amycolatopsis sp.]MCU1685129.1 hypothetical protein [Amycolatopsis sp.]